MKPLCEYCQMIKLDAVFLSTANNKSHHFCLGPGSRVAKSQCPFCELIRHAYYEDNRLRTEEPRTILSKVPEVHVFWDELLHERRSAFDILFLDDHRLCFVNDEQQDTSSAKHYALRSSVPGELDTGLVSQWLRTCTTQHTYHCATSAKFFAEAFPGLEVLRLIDVTLNCLVEIRAPIIPLYVALSYIWGAVPSFRLTKANLPKLMESNGFANVQKYVPRTISDAICLVSKLGVRYLWVDALCLLQNDSKDLDQGVTVMDSIYEQSWVTIIAACGQDANAGLPGVQEGSRETFQGGIEVRPGVSLGIYTDLDLLMRNSVYESRAWT
jgi:hypothetical protein